MRHVGHLPRIITLVLSIVRSFLETQEYLLLRFE